MILHAGPFRFDCCQPLIMGVVNVTPDSFSDGGRVDAAAAIDHALSLAAQGAQILDVGGESTRPGAVEVPVEEELRRVLPVVQALAGRGLPVSVDTRKPAVMREVLKAGAVMINDIQALTAPGALAILAASQAAVCLMHMQNTPRTMQHEPQYDDVLLEVQAYLASRREACLVAGIAENRIVLDPGLGFGKTLPHNLALLRGLPGLCALGQPVLVGVSRKSLLGALTGQPVGAREPAGLAANLFAFQAGARLFRVHEPGPLQDGLRVWQALTSEPRETDA
jgi:dihydropteroate synthase